LMETWLLHCAAVPGLVGLFCWFLHSFPYHRSYWWERCLQISILLSDYSATFFPQILNLGLYHKSPYTLLTTLVFILKLVRIYMTDCSSTLASLSRHLFLSLQHQPVISAVIPSALSITAITP
jgi:hypothetical protein